VRRADGSRSLKLNEGVAVHSLWRPDSVLTGGVWDTFLLVPPLLNRPVERMLVIGNAGGTIARAFGELYPDVRIDGVEIDPEVSEAGRRYMGLGDNSNLRVIAADGRPYLQLTDERYDVIVVDAYHQPYIPFYLATEEFFRLARDRLRPGGALALNVAVVPGDERLSEAIGSTLLAAFPQVWRWKPLRFNALVLALDRPVSRRILAERVAAAPREVGALLSPFRRDVEEARATAEPLTDDRAPVEWLTDRMIIDFVARGGELEEDLLPTAP
jgi:SAM-dependent methyltransferase